MKKERKTIKFKPKKKRKTWKISPITKAHSEKGYKRAEAKKEEEREIENEK